MLLFLVTPAGDTAGENKGLISTLLSRRFALLKKQGAFFIQNNYSRLISEYESRY